MNQNTKQKRSAASWLAELAKGRYGEYALSVLTALLGVACSLIPYFIIIRLITALVNGTAELPRCLTLCAWMAGCWVLRYVLHSVSTSLSHHATFHVLANTRVRLLDKLALVNALIHRDYLILGSEVHIDIYDDRLTITSPGGMADGTRIQERDIFNISSTRRNPVLADIFGRLGYMERQGSGFRKITEAYHAAHNYRDELEPKFYSDASSFQVTLYNLNYGTAINTAKVMIEDENVAITPDYLAIEVAIDGLNASQATIKKAKTVFASMGIDGIFGRSDIAAITSDSVTAAGNLITKLKKADLIEAVSGFGKGKYKFRVPKV